MIKLYLLFLMLITFGCNNPKTVLICGDHVCINKAEAEQYFEDNLILEVKIVNKKSEKEVNLIELNLKSGPEGQKKISMLSKNKTRTPVKILSNEEIERKKIELKKRKKVKEKKKVKQIKTKKPKKKEKTSNKEIETKKVVNKQNIKITDICVILEKCSIDQISKYLVKQGKEKEFPDITIREKNEK